MLISNSYIKRKHSFHPGTYLKSIYVIVAVAYLRMSYGSWNMGLFFVFKLVHIFQTFTLNIVYLFEKYCAWRGLTPTSLHPVNKPLVGRVRNFYVFRYVILKTFFLQSSKLYIHIGFSYGHEKQIPSSPFLKQAPDSATFVSSQHLVSSVDCDFSSLRSFTTRHNSYNGFCFVCHRRVNINTTASNCIVIVVEQNSNVNIIMRRHWVSTLFLSCDCHQPFAVCNTQ